MKRYVSIATSLVAIVVATQGLGCRATASPPAPTSAGSATAVTPDAGISQPLADCVPTTGAGRSPTTVRVSGDGGPTVVTTIGDAECWYRAACARPEPEGGTISVLCAADQCRCEFETVHPKTMRTVSFVAKDACFDIKDLLRRRCGGQ
jgi:hypothetical protein